MRIRQIHLALLGAWAATASLGVHAQVQGQVNALAQAPATAPSQTAERQVVSLPQALDAARKVADGLNYVGVLCVEFFILEPGPVRDALGALVVNEMAPRPHNSGHYSMDACDISQFELQVRCLAGLPLTAPRQHSPAVMLNLLGDLWFTQGPAGGGEAREPDWAAVLALPGSHLHLYGKSEARAGRKMGHLTFTGADAAQVRHTALQAAAVLGIAAF